MSNIDIPHTIYHSYCMNPIFYYFGSESDALKLKDINNMSTMDLCSVIPEDIINCPHCSKMISIGHLSLYNRYDTSEIKEISTSMKEMIMKEMKEMKEVINKRIQNEVFNKDYYDKYNKYINRAIFNPTIKNYDFT